MMNREQHNTNYYHSTFSYDGIQYAYDVLLLLFSAFYNVFTKYSNTNQYFFYSKQVSSSSWITYTNGSVTQYLQSLPFGEPFIDQRATSYDIRFKFTGKEMDSETGYQYFGARYYNSDISVFQSVDRFSVKYPSLTPYHYGAQNPVMFIDPTGDTTYRFDNNGRYVGMADLDKDGIVGSVGSFKSVKDKETSEYEQKWESTREFSFNDPSFDKSQLNDLKVGDKAITFMTQENVNALIDNAGIFDDNAQGPMDKWKYAKKESDGGKMDFGYGMFQPALGLSSGIDNDGKGGFILFENMDIAFNLLDAGNFMWGNAMRNLDISFHAAILGALYYNANDSKADLRAIGRGYYYFSNTTNCTMNNIFKKMNNSSIKLKPKYQ